MYHTTCKHTLYRCCFLIPFLLVIPSTSDQTPIFQYKTRRFYSFRPPKSLHDFTLSSSSPILGDPGADKGGEGKFWLLIGARKLVFFWHQSEARTAATVGTGLVRHCPQGLFSPIFTFLRVIFFRPFRLSLAPFICPWVSEDGSTVVK